MTEFLAISVVGLVLSEVLLAVFIRAFMMNDMLAKVITTAIVMVFNFITRKLFLEDRAKTTE